MVRPASLFSQLIALFSRRELYRLVNRHRAERYSKGLSSWDHFVVMLCRHPAQAKSLREISGGLAFATCKLRHLGSPQKEHNTKKFLLNRSWLGRRQVVREP